MDFPFYFPIAVLLLDDDQDVLDNATQAFSYMFPGRNIYKFSASSEAIEFCHGHALQFSALPNNVPFNSMEARGEATFETGLLNIAALEQHARSVGMIVLDYTMPEMSGVEVARKICKYSIPKILLTGQATTAEALLAFNDGLIDRYIAKDENNVLVILKDYILELEEKYFALVNKQFWNFIGESTLSVLAVPEVRKALQAVCLSMKARIVVPSFSPPGLFISTISQERFLFVVIDDDIMQGQIEIAMIENVSQESIDCMRAGTHIYLTDVPADAKAGLYPIEPLSVGTYLSKIRMMA